MHVLFTPDWQPIHTAFSLPAWVQPWLAEQGSMTQRLQTVCQHALTVQVLQHEFVPAPDYVETTLGLARHAPLLQREVLLCDGETPLVFACSLLPEAALHGRYAELKQLGSRPLGHWLFSEPVLQRQTIQVKAIASHNPLFALLPSDLARPATLWGRKALFTGADYPFLVSEFFLPALRERVA